jgi:hypothetical protein
MHSKVYDTIMRGGGEISLLKVPVQLTLYLPKANSQRSDDEEAATEAVFRPEGTAAPKE